MMPEPDMGRPSRSLVSLPAAPVGGAVRARSLARWAGLVCLIAIALLCAGCGGRAPEHLVIGDPAATTSIEGRWRFQEGDDPRWADPALDDATWRLLEVPGIWRFQGVKGDGFGWYRRRFDVGDALAGRDLGVQIAYTYWAYEVYVNGRLLEGRYRLPSRGGVLPAGGVNVFRIPHDVLRPKDNVIALRTQGGMGYGGVYRENTRMGEFGAVSRALDREIVVQLGLAGICFFIGLYHLLIFLNRQEQRAAYLSYAVYALVLGAFLPGYAGFWYVVSESHWLNTFAEFGSFTASVPLMPIFMHAFFRVPQNRFTRGFAWLTALSLAWLFGEAAIRGSIGSFLVYFPSVVVAFTVTFVYSLAIAVRAARRREKDAWLMVASFVFFSYCTTNDVLHYFVLLPGGLRLGHWGFLGFCIGMAIAIGNQYSRMTQNLAKLSAGLEAEVQKQTVELRAQNEKLSTQAEELRSLDVMKRQFYTNVSHELRTPLTLILGFLRSLRGRVGSDEGALRDVDAAQRNAAHLLREINDLLDVSRLEAGRMTLSAAPVDLGGLVREVAEHFTPASESRGRKLVLELGSEPEVVYLDFDKIRKIVFNLLSNAYKFTDEERGVITVRLARPDADHLALEVADNGIGIAESQLPRIFERFRQADGSTTRKYEGTGIGLALVKEIAELHGARVDVRSKVGEGSTFAITFRRGRAHLADDQVTKVPADAAATRSEAISELQKLTAPTAAPTDSRPISAPAAGPEAPEILVVEDHRDLRDYLVSLLAKDHRVRSASDGAEALDLLKAGVPDLIVSDVMMPRVDGYELCATVKSTPATAHVPVILLTAQAGLAPKVRGLEARADDYLTKPFHEEELLARVKNLLLIGKQAAALREVNRRLEVRVLEQADQLQRRGRLRRFLPPALAEELLAEDAGTTLERRRRTVAVLSAELCDFDELAGAVEPEDLTVLFGRFHALVTDTVFKAGGTLVSVHNGSLLAVFGAPREQSEAEASRAAVRAGRALLDAVAALDETWQELDTGHTLALRGGLDVGHATVGAFGDGDWASFAAVGGPAARAPRLSGCASPGEIVVTRRAALHATGETFLGPEPLRLESRVQEVFRLRSKAMPQRRVDPNARTQEAPVTGDLGTGPVAAEATLRSAAPVTLGNTLGGRYTIEGELGRGGMGAVYAAHDRLLGERIAIKVLHDPADGPATTARGDHDGAAGGPKPRAGGAGPDRVEKLRHEVRLARLVTHPNVCRVFDLQIVDGQACLTMELLRGRSLRSVVEEGPVAPARALAWALQICDGLAAAHACGIVHRDLKPDNVMVEQGGRVVITDFGIARPAPALTGGQSAVGPASMRAPVEGTLDYFAPEQLGGVAAAPDARTDIYALGVLLYELFTGTLPFPGEAPMKRLLARLTDPPRDPADIVPSIHPTIRAVLLRCLQRDMADRFQRVGDVALSLASVTADEDEPAPTRRAVSPLAHEVGTAELATGTKATMRV
jgi:signal transduction histidine kinase/DNA-binding response OmpR family regulator